MTELNLSLFKACPVEDVLERVETEKRLVLFEGLTDEEILRAFFNLLRMDEDARSLLHAGLATEMPEGARYEDVPLTNAYSLRFVCTIQICLPDGHSLVGTGSPAMWYGKYAEKKQIFLGEPAHALVHKSESEYYAIHYPTGLQMFMGFDLDGRPIINWRTTEALIMCVRRDQALADGRVLRDSPRGWQTEDGNVHHWGNPLWEAFNARGTLQLRD